MLSLALLASDQSEERQKRTSCAAFQLLICEISESSETFSLIRGAADENRNRPALICGSNITNPLCLRASVSKITPEPLDEHRHLNNTDLLQVACCSESNLANRKWYNSVRSTTIELNVVVKTAGVEPEGEPGWRLPSLEPDWPPQLIAKSLKYV